MLVLKKNLQNLITNVYKQLIEKNSYENKNMVIIDRGRDIDERSAILIENGVFKGLGFFQFKLSNK